MIGSPNASATGYYSVSGASTGDWIYISHEFCNQMGCVRSDENEYPGNISVVSQVGGGDLTKNYNITCPSDYRNDTQGLCDSQIDVDNYFSDHNHLASILMSMRNVYSQIGSYTGFNGYTAGVTVYYPEKSGESKCRGSFAGYTYNRYNVCIAEGNWEYPMILAHELGHVLLFRMLFNSTDATCSLGSCDGGTPAWGEAAEEKCVVSEGWADFVSGATYFAGYAADPYYRSTSQNLEGDTTIGNSGSLACVSNNSGSPHRRRGNAARYFWDLYDGTTEGDDGNDSIDLTIAQVKSIWREFYTGTSNRRDCESDDNGRNIYDYRYYESSESIDSTDVMEQNCLDAQDEPI